MASASVRVLVTLATLPLPRPAPRRGAHAGEQQRGHQDQPEIGFEAQSHQRSRLLLSCIIWSAACTAFEFTS